MAKDAVCMRWRYRFWAATGRRAVVDGCRIACRRFAFFRGDASGDMKDNVPAAGGWVSHTSLSIHRPCRSVDGFHLVELRATADRAREVLTRMERVL
jgi:hypothetical protein